MWVNIPYMDDIGPLQVIWSRSIFLEIWDFGQDADGKSETKNLLSSMVYIYIIYN